MSFDIERAITELELLPHPEGGFYREVFRSPTLVNTPRGERAASTSIYFALRGGDFSGWHRVASDEVWHHYAGGEALLHLLDDSGHRIVRLGPDRDAGQVAQAVVPAGVWQATEAVDHALFGCTVAPGFDFADFELADESLVEAQPGHEALVRRLIRTAATG